MVITEIAFDKNSYLRENAQITVAAKYTIKPNMKKNCFPSSAHFFKMTSPDASSIAARITRIKKHFF